MSDNKNLFAVLVLSNPPSPMKAEDWYWNKIAGVPFLLRNILNIQQAGVKRLILFAGKNGPAIEELCQRAGNDNFQGSVNREKDFVDQLANRDFTYLLFVMAVIGSLDIFIGLTAVGANALAGYLIYNKYKTAS